MKNFIFILAFWLCVDTQVFASRQEIRLAREDGSVIEGVFDRPEGDEAAAVVVFIDGSQDRSVIASHNKLAERLNARNVGIVSLEKRGIQGDRIDEDEYRAHDCFEERLHDYVLLLSALQKGAISGCNRQVVLLGASEGGKIAPRLSLAFPVQGVVLIASGGGLPFGEEMKYQSQQLIEQLSAFERFCYKMRGVLFPQEIEQHYETMLRAPESLERCGPKTWKWFASYLRYPLLADLLQMEAPVYLIHGEKDSQIPIKSADRIHEAFRETGKDNLVYARYSDLGHALTGRDDVYQPLLDWICERVVSLKASPQ